MTSASTSSMNYLPRRPSPPCSPLDLRSHSRNQFKFGPTMSSSEPDDLFYLNQSSSPDLFASQQPSWKKKPVVKLSKQQASFKFKFKTNCLKILFHLKEDCYEEPGKIVRTTTTKGQVEFYNPEEIREFLPFHRMQRGKCYYTL